MSMWFATLASLFLTFCAFANAECVSGIGGVCSRNCTQLAPYCNIGCVCTLNASTVFEVQPFSVSGMLNGTLDSAVFVWLSQGFATGSNATMRIGVDDQQIVSTFMSDSSNSSLTTVFQNSSAPVLHYSFDFSPMDPQSTVVSFSAAIMPCVPFKSFSVWDVYNKHGQFAWAPSPGMQRNLFQVDFLLKNYSLGEDAPWEVRARNLNTTSWDFDFLEYQCDPIQVAFRTNLVVPGFPSIECMSMSSPSAKLSMNLAPIKGNVTNVAVVRVTTGLYTVTTTWTESPNLGGCHKVSYRLTLLSLDVAQFYYGEWLHFDEGKPDQEHTWVVHNATLKEGVQYEVILDVYTNIQGFSAYSSQFSVPKAAPLCDDGDFALCGTYLCVPNSPSCMVECRCRNITAAAAREALTPFKSWGEFDASHSGAVFVWGYDNAYSTGMANMSVVADGQVVLPVASTTEKFPFSRSVSVSNSSDSPVAATIFFTPAAGAVNVSLDFAMSIMPCKLALLAPTWDPETLMGSVAWVVPEGIRRSVIEIDLLVANYTPFGNHTPLYTFQSNVQSSTINFNYPRHECKLLRFAAVSRLAVSDIPSVACAETSDMTDFLSLAVPPSTPSFVHIGATANNSSNTFALNFTWAESVDYGGCTDVLYTLLILPTPSVDSNFSAHTTMNATAPNATRTWVIPNATLSPGLYSAIIYVFTSGGEGMPAMAQFWVGPEPSPTPSSSSSPLSVGAIAGIAVGGCMVLFVAAFLIARVHRRRASYSHL